jgi:hypothetical protein
MSRIGNSEFLIWKHFRLEAKFKQFAITKKQMEPHTQTLEEISSALNQVGDLLSAIDRQQGDQVQHWQMISRLEHRVRRLTRKLPDDVFIQLPCLAKFVLSSNPLYNCWSDCRDEVGEFMIS